MAENNLTQITDSNFAAEVLQSGIPVLVDFWAPWCGPCQAIAPIFAELAEELQGKVKFAKLNVDENSTIAAQHGVRSIPTLLLFKEGKVAATTVGSKSKAELAEFIDNQL